MLFLGERALAEGRITKAESREFFDFYEGELDGYTYLESEQDAEPAP